MNLPPHGFRFCSCKDHRGCTQCSWTGLVSFVPCTQGELVQDAESDLQAARDGSNPNA